MLFNSDRFKCLGKIFRVLCITRDYFNCNKADWVLKYVEYYEKLS